MCIRDRFKATSFEELFQGTKALPWGDWIPVDGKFTVVGKSVKSTLHSVPDCQAIVKKAIVEKPVSYTHLAGFFSRFFHIYFISQVILYIF